MAAAPSSFAYPYDLDSDEEYGSDEHDWIDDDDVQSLSNRMGAMRFHTDRRTIPNTPPPGYPGSSSKLPSYAESEGRLCIVCGIRPRNVQPNGRSYPTCGLTCASRLKGPAQRNTPSGRTSTSSPLRLRGYQSQRATPKPSCVICKTRSAYGDYMTCGLECAEKLSKDGGDPTMCDYCHLVARAPGESQCSGCVDKAKVACLLCKCRPMNGRYHLCGRTCKRIATRRAPLILEVPKTHVTFAMVNKKYQSGWKDTTRAMPPLQRVYKIIEDDEFLRPYNEYKKRVKNERFRYHGTGRQCQLGVTTTELCTSPTCPICNILKTSFKVSIAKASGAFGQGVYSSSASNKANSYCGSAGAMLLTKVVLGKVRTVTGWNEVMALPDGFDSVVFDRMGGNLNETIVYSDDAIRPVFMLMF